GTSASATTLSSDESVTLIGRSRRSGFAHCPHLGRWSARARSTRLSFRQDGHSTGALFDPVLSIISPPVLSRSTPRRSSDRSAYPGDIHCRRTQASAESFRPVDARRCFGTIGADPVASLRRPQGGGYAATPGDVGRR